MKPFKPSGKNSGRKSKAVAVQSVTEKATLGFPRFGGLDPFPPTMRRKFAYSQFFRLTGGTGGVAGTSQVFRLNSLYDPDLTGTGHQPYGYDQLCAAAGPYSRYKVTGCSVTARIVAPSLDDGAWVGIAVHNPGSSATIAGLTLDAIAEKHNTKCIYISGTGEQEKVHTINMPSFAPYANITKQQFDADVDNFTAPYNSNPGNAIRLELAAVEPFVDSIGVNVLIQIEFDAVLYTRVQLTQS